MKKLSLLVALALLITVGGVYATWNYAQGDATSKTGYLDKVTLVADSVVDSAKGTFEIDTTNLKITVDDTNNDHVAELLIEGDIKITFTPSTGADKTVQDNGILMQYTLSTTDNYNFGSRTIFSVDTETQFLNDTASKTATVTADDLKALISLNGDISLPDVETYEQFKTALHSGAIGITVSEKTA